MSNKNIVVIVGNGLNRLIAEVAKNQPKPKRLGLSEPVNPGLVSQRIHDLCSLWDQFNCFDAIQRFMPDLSIEKTLELWYHFTDVIKNDERNRGELQGINSVLEDYIGGLIFNNVKKVTQKFIEHEWMDCYKDIRKLFPYFGTDFKRSLRINGVNKLFIASTNYDGILDTILIDNRKFIPDSFCQKQSNPKYLGLSKWALNKYPIQLVHIHGSYKFYNAGSETFKIVDKGNYQNENPVIILDQPVSKEKRILNDSALKIYFEKLVGELKVCDRLIILGNSFQNEPHLKKIIKKNFNRLNTELVICDLYPEQVEHELRDYYIGPVHNFTTDRLDSEAQLLNLFDQLFGDNLMYCDRNVLNFSKVA